MKAEFRSTNPQDGPAIAAFLQRIFGMPAEHPTIGSRSMQWKYWDPSPNWPGSRGYVLAQQDKITAHGCVVPLTYAMDGGSLHIVHLIDWAADPKSVGSGITLLKQISHLAGAVMSVGGGELTQKILPVLGFKTCGQVTRYALPLRPWRQLREQRNPSWRTGAKFLRSISWSWRAPSGRPQPDWEIRRIMPDQLASSAMSWPTPGGKTLIAERNPELMCYFLRCPTAPMELYSVLKKGRARGYFLLSYAPAQARLADLWIEAEDSNDWDILVQLAVRQARQNPAVAEIITMSNDPVISRSLLACGFHARDTDPLNLLTAKGTQLPAVPLGFKMLDGDIAYLHSGHPDFWA